MRTAIAIMFITIVFPPCFAQEQEAPQSLVGFLKPGTYIGMVSHTNSDLISIHIYTERDHAIAVDLRKLPLDELAAKYDSVATKLEQTRNDYMASLLAQGRQLTPGTRIGLQLRDPMESFYKITAAGDDYILVTSSLVPTKRRVLATRFISSIDWRDELEFGAAVEMVRDSTDRTKQ